MVFLEDEIVLYSTGCPKCSILKRKLDENGITYTEVNDADLMLAKGMVSVPMLEVDGDIMDFANAVRWVNGR